MTNSEHHPALLKVYCSKFYYYLFNCTVMGFIVTVSHMRNIFWSYSPNTLLTAQILRVLHLFPNMFFRVCVCVCVPVNLGIVTETLGKGLQVHGHFASSYTTEEKYISLPQQPLTQYFLRNGCRLLSSTPSHLNYKSQGRSTPQSLPNKFAFVSLLPKLKLRGGCCCCLF